MNQTNSNFKTALKELVNGKEETTTTQAAPVAKKPVTAEPIASAPKISPTVEPKKSETIISADTEICGDMKTSGNVCINGKITGNIISAGMVSVTGTVNGNITAANLTVKGSIAGTEIQVSDSINYDNGATITANLTCKSIILGGKFTGNINASGACILRSTAIVEGDVETAELTIEAGAKIKGKITTIEK